MSPLLVAAAIIYQRNKVLVTLRNSTAPYPNLWEFPGGKVEPGEDPKDAIVRELQEELAIKVEVVRVYDVVFHRYPERDVLIVAYECAWVSGIIQEIEVAAHRWATIKELASLPLLPADVVLVKRLQVESRL